MTRPEPRSGASLPTTRRRLLAATALVAIGGPAHALRLEPAPRHMIEAHGSAAEARRRHAALYEAARETLIGRGRSAAEVETALADHRCPDCGAHTREG